MNLETFCKQYAIDFNYYSILSYIEGTKSYTRRSLDGKNACNDNREVR